MRNPLKRKKVPQDTKKVRKVFHGFVYATMEIDSPIQGMFTKKNVIGQTRTSYLWNKKSLFFVRFEPGLIGRFVNFEQLVNMR